MWFESEVPHEEHAPSLNAVGLANLGPIRTAAKNAKQCTISDNNYAWHELRLEGMSYKGSCACVPLQSAPRSSVERVNVTTDTDETRASEKMSLLARSMLHRPTTMGQTDDIWDLLATGARCSRASRRSPSASKPCGGTAGIPHESRPRGRVCQRRFGNDWKVT